MTRHTPRNPARCPARRPVFPLALALFLLAMLLFWLALGLGGRLLPARADAMQSLPWPESARHSVRRVVLQAPDWHTGDTELEWSATRAPQVDVINIDRSSPPNWQLAQEGDTLYVRLPQAPAPEGQPATPAGMPRARGHVQKIVLPLGVDTVQGRRLAVSEDHNTRLPPRLTLQAQEIRFATPAVLERLHLIGLPGCKDCDDCGKDWRTQADINLKAPHAAQVLIEAAEGRVALYQLHPDARVHLHASPGVSLQLNDVAQLPRIGWQTLAPERAQALKQAFKSGTATDCAGPDSGAGP